MSKLIRHAQKRGTALFVTLQLIGISLLSLVSFFGGPQQPVKAPAETQVSGPAQTQTQAAQASTAPMSRDILRRKAVMAKKL